MNRNKINILACGMILLMIVAVSFYAVNNLKAQEYDAIRINLSGRQRMLFQKMTKETLLYKFARIDKETMLSTVKVFNATLIVLKDGGDAPLNLFMTEFKTLPKMEDRQTWDQLERIVDLWVTFKQEIESFLQDKDDLSMNYIIDNNTKLLNEIDSAVVMMQRSAEKKVTQLYLIILSVVLISLLIFTERIWALSRANKKLLLDITERERVEEALRKSKKRFQDVAECTHAWIWEVDYDGRYTYASPLVEQVLGYTPKEIMGRQLYDFVHPDDSEHLGKAAFEQFTKKQPFRKFINRNVRKDGQEAWFSTSGTPIFDDAGNLLGFLGSSEDITKFRKKDEELQRYSEKLEEKVAELKQANERTNHLNLVLRAIRNVNQLLTQERGRDKLLQGVCNNLVENREYNGAWIVLFDERGNLITTAEAGLGEEFVPLREQLEKGERTECGRRVSSQSGVVVINDPSTECTDCPLAGQYAGRSGMAIRLEHEGRFYGQLTVSTIPAVCENEEERSLFEEVAKDIAFGLYSMEAEKERKKAEGEREEAFKDLDFAHKKLVKSQIRLIRSEKMNAIGTLVAGIAHELNNPMMGILNYVQYCRKHTPSGDKRYGVLEDAESEVKRCVDIVDNLLTFSHMEKEGKEEPVEAACSAILERVFKLITHRVKSERVSVDKRYAADIPDIWIRANRIQQVFLNLLNNALDALKESEKKEIEIEMRREKNYIAVSIADTGPGIAPKDLEHIFEPFFTTKPVGGGTGLGLFVTQNIIEQEGGSVTCESKVGEGTKFTVKLPATAKGAEKS